MREGLTSVGIHRLECLAMVEIQPSSKGVLQESVLCKGIFFSCRDVEYERDTALHRPSRSCKRIWSLQKQRTSADFWAAPYIFLECWASGGKHLSLNKNMASLATSWLPQLHTDITPKPFLAGGVWDASTAIAVKWLESWVAVCTPWRDHLRLIARLDLANFWMFYRIWPGEGAWSSFSLLHGLHCTVWIYYVVWQNCTDGGYWEEGTRMLPN